MIGPECTITQKGWMHALQVSVPGTALLPEQSGVTLALSQVRVPNKQKKIETKGEVSEKHHSYQILNVLFLFFVF